MQCKYLCGPFPWRGLIGYHLNPLGHPDRRHSERAKESKRGGERGGGGRRDERTTEEESEGKEEAATSVQRLSSAPLGHRVSQPPPHPLRLRPLRHLTAPAQLDWHLPLQAACRSRRRRPRAQSPSRTDLPPLNCLCSRAHTRARSRPRT